MDFFQKLKKTVVSVTKKAADKSTDLVEVTKIKFALSEKEGEVENIYKEMGEAVYKSYNTGENPEEEISTGCQRISEIKEEISELRDRLREYKNIKLCKSCGKEIPGDSDFCNKCGHKIQ